MALCAESGAGREEHSRAGRALPRGLLGWVALWPQCCVRQPGAARVGGALACGMAVLFPWAGCENEALIPGVGGGVCPFQLWGISAEGP